MGEREDACERLLENIEDALVSLERGKEECSVDDWELFAPEDLEEIIEHLRDMVATLNMKMTSLEDVDVDE